MNYKREKQYRLFMMRIFFISVGGASFFSVFNIYNMYAQEISVAQATPQQALTEKKDRFNAVKTLADALFNPVVPTITPPLPNPYPITSVNENAVEKMFGSEGLNIDATVLQHIKIFYFYLEYVTKLEIAGKIVAYAKQNNVDPISELEKKSWKDFIQDMSNRAGSWQKLLDALSIIEQPLLTMVQGTINVQRWQDITTTPFWQSIRITPEMIINSSFWQRYLKYSIVKFFEQDSSLISAIFDVEKRIFLYIPNIEVAYYNTDFTYLRNSAEYFRLHLVLADKVRDRFITVCNDWKNFIDPVANVFDLSRIYQEAQVFRADNFYTLISLADQSFQDVVQKAEKKNFTIENQQYAQDPFVQAELTCLAMLKNIQAQLHYLFDSNTIDKTISVMRSMGAMQPQPSVLWYQPEDYWYLKDLALTLKEFERAAPEESNPSIPKIVAGGRGDEKIIVQDFGQWLSDQWNNIKKEGKQVVEDIKQTGKDIAEFGTDVWSGIKDEAKVVMAGAKSLGALLSGNPKDAEKLLQDAATLQQKVADEIKKTVQDAEELLDDAVNIATDATAVAADLTGIAIAEITRNTQLADALDGALKAGAGILINMWAATQAELFALQGALLYLTADAVAIAADIVTKSIMDVVRGDYAQLGKDVLDGMERMVADVATTLWSTITFVGKYFIAQLMDAIKLVGYVTAMLTEIAVKNWSMLFKGFAAIFEAFGWQSAQDALMSASQEIEAHRRLVSSTITTVLLVGAVIATDGVALPLIAMTVGPQLFQVGGAFQQDEQAKHDKAEQKIFLDHYKTFVENNKIIAQHEKDVMVMEVNKKLSDQITNQERDLGFYQNYLDSYFGSMKEQMSFYLGSALAPQLVSDKQYNLRYADVGSTYGFRTGDGKNTGLLNLNPSQGFSLYSQVRDTFSQEIAVYPAISLQKSDQEVTVEPVRKFWFNQKETCVLDQPINEVHVRLQALYVLNSFYIGIYFGGESINVQDIIETQRAPINPSHLAKMLVYKKENQNDPVTLGLYEHEGAEWISASITAPVFEVGTWYHMKMLMQDATVQIKVWQEGKQEPSSGQIFSVQKTSQKTIGVISSGASVQYQFISPTVSVQKSSLVMPITWSTEKERSIKAQKIMDQMINPSLGIFNLNATDKVQILKGQFIYTSKATNFKDKDGNVVDDYLIFGIKTGSQQAPIISEQGASPRKQITMSGSSSTMLQKYTDACVVSLITGNAYDKQGRKLTTCTNVLDSYLKTHGPLPDALTEKLQTYVKNYRQMLIEPIQFNNITLQATNLEDFARGQFIYQAVSPTSQLKDQQGAAIKDEQGNFVYDYFVMVDQTGAVGSIYSSDIKRIQSLVTGLVYEKDKTEPIDSGYETGSQALNDYAPQLGKRRPELDQAIDKAVQTYNALVQQPAANKPLNVVPVQQTTQDSLAQPTGSTTSSAEQPAPTIVVAPAQESLLQRSDEAASDQFSWGE